ncbi:hypothetical protein BPOR_0025g00050 [Botrytis porri]|uniref:Amino acid permease/ SLC12A domain-containing protein n=1 Tax=Botrytis porri TaxID=87229 RepID=A0A4Z1L3Z4_9HELO|nr:hypothetical protein BPOR_0025g00050 [Botrytis porri]
MEEKSSHSPVTTYPEESTGYGEKALPNYNGNDIQAEGLISENVDGLKRELSGRQIQMVTIGGSIGTALFISIGSGLTQGGPGSLLIAFILYSCFLGLVNNCIAEISFFMPVSGSFVRMGSKWVDEAFGFMLGWNFFLYEAILIPWEISALNLVLTFWSDNIPLAAVCAGCIFLYGVINLFAVKWYGESEFWLSGGKVVLIAMIFSFTFITMVGGNPKHDAYGFRYWKEPGAFAEYVTTGSLGRFEGFLAALWKAAFTIVGPEYIAMMSGEASHPRKNLKRAFKTIYWRFGVFFIGGALACGIVIPYNDKKLIAILSSGGSETGTAASSPYVLAMQNLGIGVLPHITNALLVTSIFSAGNSYVYCACRTLYSLSLDGHAPRFLRKCTKSGVPIYCFCVTMIFPFLSFLAVGNSSAQVITWLANLTEASQIIDYICMCTIYILFYRALKVQGIDRSTLPYVGWDTGTFFSYYTMVFVCPVLYGGWKIVKKTKVIKPEDADLVWERPIIDAYEANMAEKHISFWQEVKIMMGFGKKEVHVE